MRCDECRFWAGGFDDAFYGICSALPGAKVEIDIAAGWTGGAIDSVETEADFFCGYFEAKGKEGGTKK